jgi:hypothetical protein
MPSARCAARPHQHLGRQEAAAYATCGGRGVRYARRPRRTLSSHDRQRASRKLSVHAVVLCASCSPLYCSGAMRIMVPTTLPKRYAPAASVQSSYLTLSGCQLLSQGGPSVRLARHRRRQQALRRQRCTARRIGGCDKHCDTTTIHSPTAFHTDAQHGRDVRYAHTVTNAHHVSQTCPPTILPRCYAPAASVQSSYLTLSG